MTLAKPRKTLADHLVIYVSPALIMLLVGSLSLYTPRRASNASASVPPPQFVEKSTAIVAGDGVCTALAAATSSSIHTFKATAPQATRRVLRDFIVNTLIPRIERGVGDFHRIGEPTKDKPAWNALWLTWTPTSCTSRP